MVNPFVRFIPELIGAFLERGEHLLVSQTFGPGVEVGTEGKQALLFSQYNDTGFAQIHLQAVRADRFAALINLHKEQHKKKVLEMLQPGSAYLVFSSLVRDRQSLQDFADEHCTDSLRRYIRQHTTWKISGKATLRPRLQLIFGELFIVLHYQQQQLRIKFREVENY